MPGLRVEFRRLQFLFGITLTISLLLAQNAMGQASYTAQVRGTVTDQTGAVVVNALVTITNDGTNVSTSVHTDDHGLYLLTGLRPSTYTIKVESEGFRSAESKNVVLAVDQQSTLELQPEARRLQHHGGRDHSASPARYRQRHPWNGRQQ